MIPTPYLNEWRQIAPWPDDGMVEQDLVISRLLERTKGVKYLLDTGFNNTQSFQH